MFSTVLGLKDKRVSKIGMGHFYPGILQYNIEQWLFPYPQSITSCEKWYGRKYQDLDEHVTGSDLIWGTKE